MKRARKNASKSGDESLDQAAAMVPELTKPLHQVLSDRYGYDQVKTAVIDALSDMKKSGRPGFSPARLYANALRKLKGNPQRSLRKLKIAGRRANFGKGGLFNFHGAFKEKADAEAKEKKVPGSFIKTAWYKSGPRYVVVTAVPEKKPAAGKQNAKRTKNLSIGKHLKATFARAVLGESGTFRRRLYSAFKKTGLKKAVVNKAIEAKVDPGSVEDAISALRNLGYKARQAQEAVARAIREGKADNFDGLFRTAQGFAVKRNPSFPYIFHGAFGTAADALTRASRIPGTLDGCAVLRSDREPFFALFPGHLRVIQ